MMPRNLPLLLPFLILVADLTVGFSHPSSAFSSSSSPDRPRPRPPALTQRHQSFFSTYSPKPWSRSSWPWRSQHQVAHFGKAHLYNSTNEVRLDGYGDQDEDGISQGCPCPENATLADSSKHLSHEFVGESGPKQVICIVIRAVWIFILIYLLGTTASDYFSCTLEKLSEALKLSPAVAGVTLLAIGNGAPDVFSSVAAFVSSDTTASIGFASVLGGALFVTTVVSGAVALVTAGVCKKAGYQRISIVCFVRDALFLLASVGILTVVLLDGKVHLWEAISFLCVYVVYAAAVWAAEMLENRHRGASLVLDPLVPKGRGETYLPFWSNSQQQDHHLHMHSQDVEVELEYYLEDTSRSTVMAKCKDYALAVYKYGIEWPLAIPRRLTIPVVEEERWSRPFAILTCILAPLFVGALYIVQFNSSNLSIPVALGVGGAIGILLGLLAFFNTENKRPPHRGVWAWLAGGFFMSLVWFYVIADLLVSSLETLGSIFQISPAILGLTVLAWGNSIGDLVADLSLACTGRDGVQIAISGCYAGPLFNTVVGLGLSLVVACSTAYPEPLVIADDDGSLFFIIGFLGAGLAWALVMMPLKRMQLSRSFGAGLVLLYCGFLVTGMCYAIGWILR